MGLFGAVYGPVGVIGSYFFENMVRQTVTVHGLHHRDMMFYGRKWMVFIRTMFTSKKIKTIGFYQKSLEILLSHEEVRYLYTFQFFAFGAT